ncbi:hypothetical protein [Flavobacterium sp.]|jgi:hypothetical protein|uniref:hypothetical protein n=1 Tax=Flavobacterium sp. TaxID=239 RepID=UPI0037BECE25
MKNIEEVLYNPDFNEKQKKFNEGLDNINSKYKEYFDARKSKQFPKEKDSLALHYWIINQYGNLTFGFLPESDIDENIKKESVNLFHEIFHDKTDTVKDTI